MLRIWMGRANTGKSGEILNKIKEAGGTGTGQVLLVPEHATHQAELDLAQVCGDAASRFAEALSFRQLARRVLAETGGLAEPVLDGGGKLLTMCLAVQELRSALEVYRQPSRKAPFLEELVTLSDELQACRVPAQVLYDAAGTFEGLGGGKLRDIAALYAAYETKLRAGGEDRRDLMAKLTERIADSRYLDGKDVYLDGFSYFTAQEEKVIAHMLTRSRSVTVALLGEEGSGLEIFQQSLQTKESLLRLAKDLGADAEVRAFAPKAPETALEHLERHFFGRGARWEGDCGEVELYRAEGAFAETEYVASQILALVRSGQYRFRDIAVMARNLEDYAPTIENVFERYGVPIYLSRRSDILEKPVLSLIAGALDAVTGGYEYEDMFRWLKTGFAGLSGEKCDKLENYVIRWDIHGSMWLSESDWTANPDGWQESFTERQRSDLEEVNALRRRVAEPLRKLRDGLRDEPTARGKLKALWAFLDDIHLTEQLEKRTEELESLGERQRAEEYGQLWEILCGVADQFADTLGEEELETEEFARLLKLLLTQYDVGTIPVSLDQVQVSQITRNDRHRVRCLFLMGANDHVLPAVQTSTGLLTREDRLRLSEAGITLGPSGMDLFHMELRDLYAALALPTDRLTVTWPAADAAGEPLRPSFVVGRIRALLPGAAETVEPGDHAYRLTAPIPALEMAGSRRGGALWDYFAQSERYAPQLTAMDRAAHMTRGRLSPQAVESLYGKSYRMSASRIDKVSSCHFAYFMQYGLRARERTPAGLDAAQVGTFLHYVLETVTRAAQKRGGFAALGEGELEKLIRAAVQTYIAESMPGYDSRDARFKYLFTRLEKTVTTIVKNVAEELTESDFVPMEFELEFSDGGKLPAISIHAGDASLTVVGKVDRVDGWLKDGKLYLRVVDYKSGKKAFDLSDVCHGLNIQMLLYLFTLQREGESLFGHEIVPAGVLYLPARDVLVGAPRSAEAAAVRSMLDKELRRSGMVLGEPEVLRAMEHSALESPRFLPLTLGRDGSVTKGIASAEELGKLGRYVDKLLERIARELSAGNIDADPCGRGENDNACMYCEFASACHFMEQDENDHMEMIYPVKPGEFWQHVEKTIGEEETV